MGVCFSLTTEERLGHPSPLPILAQRRIRARKTFLQLICCGSTWACLCPVSCAVDLYGILKHGAAFPECERCPAAGQATTEISGRPGPVIFLSPGSHLPRLSLPRSHIMPQDIKCSKSYYLIWRYTPKSWGWIVWRGRGPPLVRTPAH